MPKVQHWTFRKSLIGWTCKMFYLPAGDQGDKGDRGATERGPIGALGAPGLPGREDLRSSFYQPRPHFWNCGLWSSPLSCWDNLSLRVFAFWHNRSSTTNQYFNPSLSLLLQVNPVGQLTAGTVVMEKGDLAELLVSQVSPDPLERRVLMATASPHSASCLWWHRACRPRTPAWRAPVRCEQEPLRKYWETQRKEKKRKPWWMVLFGLQILLFLETKTI